MKKVKYKDKWFEFPDDMTYGQIRDKMKENVEEEKKPKKVDLSTKRVTVACRGPFLPVALRLGRDFGNVDYCLLEEETHPKFMIDQIGKGYDKIHLVDDFWKSAHQSDAVIFTGVYNGNLQAEVVRQGIPCFCSMGSEILETVKSKMYKMLSLAKLPVPTYHGKPVWEEGYVKGVDTLQRKLKDEKDKIIKCDYYRGDMETKKYTNAFLSEPWFDEVKQKIGLGHEDFKLIVEDLIKSVCEGGYDTPNLNGEIPDNISIGYEAKDQLYANRIVKKLPKIFQYVHDQMKPAFKKLGYQGWQSTEIIFDEEGNPHVIDLTHRFGRPPSELLMEQYTSFSQNVWDLAHGIMPTMEFEDEYGFYIALWSETGIKHWVPVQFPKEIERYVKLINSKKTADGYYVLPKDKDGDMGAVIGTGKTLKEAKEKAFERLKMIQCDELEHGDEIAFEKIERQIEAGKRFGIDFG